MSPPIPVTADLFRFVLGHLPTGVAVITADDGDGPVGMAVNSLTSVSIDPPLILVCSARGSGTWERIRRHGHFCVNVMAAHHEEITRRFARRGADRFAGLATQPRPSGPGLSDAVAWIDCRVRDEHDGGDHLIVVANVIGLQAAPDVSPLVFFRGGYGDFVAAARRTFRGAEGPGPSAALELLEELDRMSVGIADPGDQ